MIKEGWSWVRCSDGTHRGGGRRATKARPHGFICSDLQCQQCLLMLPKAHHARILSPHRDLCLRYGSSRCAPGPPSRSPTSWVKPQQDRKGSGPLASPPGAPSSAPGDASDMEDEGHSTGFRMPSGMLCTCLDPQMLHHLWLTRQCKAGVVALPIHQPIWSPSSER